MNVMMTFIRCLICVVVSGCADAQFEPPVISDDVTLRFFCVNTITGQTDRIGQPASDALRRWLRDTLLERVDNWTAVRTSMTSGDCVARGDGFTVYFYSDGVRVAVSSRMGENSFWRSLTNAASYARSQQAR